ncbi:MAG: cupin domain-containing protein [Gaiellaceae bacterium]
MSTIVGALDDLAGIRPLKVWDGVLARSVDGEQLNLAVIELDPGSIVPEHSHENEQLGMVISGSVRFRVGTEVRELGPGGTWRIPANTPHEVHTGPDGAVVIDVFAPARADWEALERVDAQTPRWP